MQRNRFVALPLTVIALFPSLAGTTPSMATRAPASVFADHIDTDLVFQIAARTCGLRLDGAGPDARCSRYRDACLRYGNPEARCNERLEACTRCAVAYQDCEKRATGIARMFTNCDKCIGDFKRCTRNYDKKLPANRP